MSMFRGMVLLTTGQPNVHTENIKRRLARWTSQAIHAARDADSYFVGEGNVYFAQLDGIHELMVTCLDHSYWDQQDIRPYLDEAGQQDDDDLEELLTSCESAILLSCRETDDGPRATMAIARMAAAAMEPDTPVMLVPASYSIHRVGNEMRSQIGRAATPVELVPWVVNIHALGQDDLICATTGMGLFDLPDIHMPSSEEEFDTAVAAVESVAEYMVRRGVAIPVDDTMDVDGVGRLKVVEASIHNDEDATPIIRLEPA